MSFDLPLIFGMTCAGLVVLAFIFLSRNLWNRGGTHSFSIRTPEKPIERAHPELGTYYAFKDGSWWTKITSARLGYELTLRGKYSGPTNAQLQRWHEIEERLPQLLAQVPPPPESNNDGHDCERFDPSAIRAEIIDIADDLSFSVLAQVPGCRALSPLLNVSTDWQCSWEWNV